MKNILFVDDEPKVLQGLQRQLYGMRQQWTMNFVGDGNAALNHLTAHPVDIVVTDMMMPGMNGAELLGEVIRRHPEVIRIVLSGHAERETTLQLAGPAHQYLSKPCDTMELRSAILRALNLRQLLASEKLRKLVVGTDSLPTLPSSCVQLSKELESPDASLDRIASVLSRDPGMTAKIIQLVNSAFFGLPRHISDVREAITYLGVNTIRSLAVSLEIFKQFKEGNVEGFSVRKLAAHGWLTGMLARQIADLEHGDATIGDQCFLGGFLHDIGQLVLAQGLPEEFGRVLKTARAEGRTLWETELAEFGATHAGIGGCLLGLWGLPTPVVEAAMLHHQPDHDAVPGFSVAAVVHVANVLAHELAHDADGAQINLEYLSTAGLSGKVDDWRAHCADKTRIETVRSVLSLIETL